MSTTDPAADDADEHEPRPASPEAESPRRTLAKWILGALAGVAASVAVVAAMRLLGVARTPENNRLIATAALTTFILVASVLRPELPGAPRRTPAQRLAGAVATAALAGVAYYIVLGWGEP